MTFFLLLSVFSLLQAFQHSDAIAEEVLFKSSQLESATVISAEDLKKLSRLHFSSEDEEIIKHWVALGKGNQLCTTQVCGTNQTPCLGLIDEWKLSLFGKQPFEESRQSYQLKLTPSHAGQSESSFEWILCSDQSPHHKGYPQIEEAISVYLQEKKSREKNWNQTRDLVLHHLCQLGEAAADLCVTYLTSPKELSIKKTIGIKAAQFGLNTTVTYLKNSLTSEPNDKQMELEEELATITADFEKVRRKFDSMKSELPSEDRVLIEKKIKLFNRKVEEAESNLKEELLAKMKWIADQLKIVLELPFHAKTIPTEATRQSVKELIQTYDPVTQDTLAGFAAQIDDLSKVDRNSLLHRKFLVLHGKTGVGKNKAVEGLGKAFDLPVFYLRLEDLKGDVLEALEGSPKSSGNPGGFSHMLQSRKLGSDHSLGKLVEMLQFFKSECNCNNGILAINEFGRNIQGLNARERQTLMNFLIEFTDNIISRHKMLSIDYEVDFSRISVVILTNTIPSEFTEDPAFQGRLSIVNVLGPVPESREKIAEDFFLNQKKIKLNRDLSLADFTEEDKKILKAILEYDLKKYNADPGLGVRGIQKAIQNYFLYQSQIEKGYFNKKPQFHIEQAFEQ